MVLLPFRSLVCPLDSKQPRLSCCPRLCLQRFVTVVLVTVLTHAHTYLFKDCLHLLTTLLSVNCNVLIVYYVMSLFTIFLVDCLLITVAHCFPRLSRCSTMKIQTLFFIFSHKPLGQSSPCGRTWVFFLHPCGSSCSTSLSNCGYWVLVVLQTILHLHYLF